MIKKKLNKKDNIINFPSKLSSIEKEIEGILFAAAEPLDVETIENKITKRTDVKKVLLKLQSEYTKTHGEKPINEQKDLIRRKQYENNKLYGTAEDRLIAFGEKEDFPNICVPWSKCLAGYKFAGSETKDRDCSKCSGDKYFLTEYEFRSQMDVG